MRQAVYYRVHAWRQLLARSCYGVPVGGVLRTGRLRADAALQGPVDYPLGIVAGALGVNLVP